MGNNFITTTYPNLNSYLNKLINLSEIFATITIRDKNEFALQYHEMKYYKIPTFYSKSKYTKPSCRIVDG